MKYIFLFLLLSLSLNAKIIDEITVVVNDDVITKQDVTKEVRTVEFNSNQLTGFEPFSLILSELIMNPLVQKDLIKPEFMTEILIAERLLLALAKKESLEASELEVEQMMDSIIERNNTTKDEFRQSLLARGLTLESFKESLKKRSTVEKIKQTKIFPKISISDFEIENYFNFNYSKKKVFKISYLYLKESDDATEEDKKANTDKLANIETGLKEGKTFEELVKLYSDGPYKEDGGVLDWMKEDSLETSLEEQIFKLKEGEFTKPLKTANGYHIFKLIGMKYESPKSLTEAREEIYQIIAYQKWHNVFINYLDELKKKEYVDYKQENSDYGRGFSWNKWYNTVKSTK